MRIPRVRGRVLNFNPELVKSDPVLQTASHFSLFIQVPIFRVVLAVYCGGEPH